MTAKRLYVNYSLFNMRAYNLKNLWEPSLEYKGQPSKKPNYLCGVLVAKTRGHWSEEPVFAPLMQAMMQVHQATMSNLPYANVGWPIRDGDMPAPGQDAAEWAKGCWMMTGSSDRPINVDIAAAGGTCQKLAARVGVKPGDYCIIGGAVAQSGQTPSNIKLYINNVVFTHPGEEIAVGNSVSGTELIATAKQQGLNVVGFQSGGGFGQQQQPASTFGQQQQPGGFGGQPQGFQQAPAGFVAPTTESHAFGATVQGQTHQGGAAFPSNQQGFTPPNGGGFGR